VAPFLPALLLLALFGSGSALADDAQALAQAVRSFYDDGPDDAAALLEAIVQRAPQRDDAAWWLARCRLELGDPQAALLALEGRDGENIPGWRFPALEAHAAAIAGLPERAAVQAGLALELAPEGLHGDSLWAETVGVAAALAARRGDDQVALGYLLDLEQPLVLPVALRAALPELEAVLALPLAVGATLDGPVLFEARGSWWSLPAGGGLARSADAPIAAWRECAGPDLCDEQGARALRQAGVRFTPSTRDEGVLYGAAHEPLAPEPRAAGLFAWRPGGAPQRLTTAPEGALDLHPIAGPDGTTFFLRQQGGTTRLARLEPDGAVTLLAPDASAITCVAVVQDQVLLVAVEQGVSTLRALPADASTERASLTLLAVPLDLWTLRSP
jgi:hypothetical protein